MDAGLLDVLHDAGDEDVLAVGERIDVDLDRVGQVAVDEERVLAEHRVDLPGLVVRVARLDVVGTSSAACRAGSRRAAPRRGRSPSRGRRARRTGGSPAGSRGRRRSAAPARPSRRCRSPAACRPSLSSSFWKRSRSSARSITSGEVPRIGTFGLLQRAGELQRRLAAELHDDAEQRPASLLDADDLEHVLGGQRLEIEPVGGVVVGRDGLRVAVDHDRLVARLAQREAGVAAAIVELDALADAVRAAAEDDDLLRVASARPRSAGAPAKGPRRSSTCRRSARRTRRRRCRCA